ncbi:MAG: peptide chain release factor N(5)-glutamine methyltransferase [Actinomycetota bacterium]|nr:peptide chain release factor N(5)-glutamine methyltransferase [Actinomycetota bacterium]
MKARKVLDDAVKVLKASPAIDHWQRGRERIEAEDLLWHVLGEEPDPKDDVSAEDRRSLDRLVRRRATGEPIPFIKGYAEFRGLELLVRPGVFVPRDASEFLAEQATRRLRKRSRPVHVDLATGAGTIALAVANEVPRATVVGTDLSADAVKLARKNAKRLGLRARFVTGDLFEGLPRALAGTVDVVTLHPPYVPVRELKDLPEEIREWEPEHTLTDRSRDGLGLIGRTAREAPAWLSRNGWLLMEVSPDRVSHVKGVLRGEGFRDLRSTKGGPLPLTRVIVARRAA